MAPKQQRGNNDNNEYQQAREAFDIHGNGIISPDCSGAEQVHGTILLSYKFKQNLSDKNEGNVEDMSGFVGMDGGYRPGFRKGG